MTTRDDGGAAFPMVYAVDRSDEGVWTSAHAGMSLRDYFAGQALAGLLAAYDDSPLAHGDDFARLSYILADAMLDARDKEKS